MRIKILSIAVLFSLLAVPAHAQYISVAGGGMFAQNLSSNVTVGTIGGVARASFTKPAIVTVDAGTSFLPFIGINAHYSYANPEMDLRRADDFGSRALLGLRAHTLALDARVHPSVPFINPYGFVGAGFTRFSVEARQIVEVPFPGGVPKNVIAPVVTVGGGINMKFVPLIGAKIEVRDYITPMPEKFYAPGGFWHRIAVVAGIVLGR